MLRRKLLLTLLALAGLMMGLALAVLWSLQGIFGHMEHINHQAAGLMGQTHALNTTISTIEVELHRLRSGQTHHLDSLIDSVRTLHELADQIRSHDALANAVLPADRQDMEQRLRVFERHVGALATAQDPALVALHNIESLNAAVGLRDDILQITRAAQQHVGRQQDALSKHFRWLGLGMAMGFLLVINATILLLVRSGQSVLRPVEALVQASRELAREHFEYRVELAQHDEFDELARAYNSLAGQLQENEIRRIETLKQVALTLNHELNNAMAIIDLQLRLMERQSGSSETVSKCLVQIRTNLQRMAKVVEDLKHIRRIVLTDYTHGLKMLDLQRSVESPSEAVR